MLCILHVTSHTVTLIKGAFRRNLGHY